ncbi:MAG TPA: NADH-quinone oxidoreductase subunit L [Methylomirabilota bacterium]|jgi:NADH-quinone oxidoreductase subunit L|nr:NADH-quinone oxidoreductase subunit L [Methylomirabilota bacterium]
MIHLIWPIPALPLLGAVVNCFAGRRLGRRASWVAVPAVGLAFGVAAAAFWRVWQGGETFTGPLFEWIVADRFRAPVTLQLDQLSAVMLLVVTGVGFLIHLYSVGYMHDDPDVARFFTYLNLFVFSMVMLVLAGNFLLLYVFWEAVGLCSYLLIGFWYTRDAAADAGKKAFLVNRVGDVGFALGVMLLWTTVGTLDYGEVFARAPSLAVGTATAISLLLFMGACGKSAQLPLHTWLPDAMEGPTPVSALIHAATMVTAGVYLVVRAHALFERSGVALEVVAWVGIVTAVFAATIGLVQTDIKRVLAYSTISQLGYMFVGVGVGAYAAGIFHLVTHAFFKALLFLGAGSVIHALGGEQDLRKMGGLAGRLPATWYTMLVATLAIAGLPPFSGFFSKDEILAGALASGHHVIFALGVLGAALTAFYMGRLVFLTFLGRPRLDEAAAHHVHESPPVMTVPLGVLAVLAAGAGVWGLPGPHGSAIGRLLAPVVAPAGGGAEAAPPGAAWSLMAISVAAALGGLAVAWRLYVAAAVDPGTIGVPRSGIHRLLLHRYYVDELYHRLFVRPVLALSRWAAGPVDQGLIDGAVNGVAAVAVRLAGWLRRYQTGFVMNYALSMLIGGVALLAWLLWPR